MQYNILSGVKQTQPKKRRILTMMAGFALPAALLFQGFAMAQTPSSSAYPFTLVPFEYVGAAGDCGADSPAGNEEMVSAHWVDTTGNPASSIKLQKLGATSGCVSAGVDIISPVEGTAVSNLTELNFDFRDGWHCGAGSPRFNLELNGTSNAFLGCNSTLGTKTSLGNGWTHMVFSSADIASAVTTAGGTPTSTLTDLYMIADEGSDTGPDFTGTSFIDNISVNTKVVGSATVPRNRSDCRNDGWMKLTDVDGDTFADEGDCIVYAGGGKHNDHHHKHHQNKRGDNNHFKNSMKQWSQRKNR